MNFLFAMAQKNILRNTRRTVLSGLTIVIAAFVMCIMLAFEYGMVDNMRSNIINHLTGNVRIRSARFSENQRIVPVQFYIPETEKIIAAVKKIDGVKNAIPQTNLPVSIYRNGEISQATVIGTDLTQAAFFNERDTQFVSGGLPKGEREAVISEGLATRTGLKTGDKFTFMVKTASGGINGVTVTISGVAYIGDTDFNRAHFYMDYRRLAQFMRMGSNTLEILVFSHKNVSERVLNSTIIPAIEKTVQSMVADTVFEVLEWKQTNMMLQIIEMTDIIYAFVGIFFFLLASTVIFNTTMMSVLERKKEIGTLMSLGMETRSISRLFLLETALVSVSATIVGVFFGFCTVSALGMYGINLNALGGAALSGYGFSAWIYPSLHWSKYVLILVFGPTVAVCTCIFPIRMVRNVEPAEALRTET